MMRRVLTAVASMIATTSALAAGYHGPIIDTHAHIRFTDDDSLTADQGKGTAPIRAVDQAAGVDMSGIIVIAHAGQIEKARAQNDAVIAAAKADPGHFYPIASVHPADAADAMAELDRVAALGVKVIKLHPNTQNFDVLDPAVASVVQHCGDKGLIVLFDSYKPWDVSEVGKFLLLAVKYPKVRLILAHMGFSTFREAAAFAMLPKLGRASSVYFDLSAIASFYANSPVAPELLWTIRKFWSRAFPLRVGLANRHARGDGAGGARLGFQCARATAYFSRQCRPAVGAQLDRGALIEVIPENLPHCRQVSRNLCWEYQHDVLQIGRSET